MESVNVGVGNYVEVKYSKKDYPISQGKIIHIFRAGKVPSKKKIIKYYGKKNN
jgi:hypothetical protein